MPEDGCNRGTLGALVSASPGCSCVLSGGDQKVIELVPGPDRCSEPPRLLAAAGPGLQWSGRVKIFRQDFRIFASWPIVFLLLRKAWRIINLATQLRETLFQLALFRTDFLCKDLRQLLVQKPE